jgi:hypothetical protein
MTAQEVKAFLAIEELDSPRFVWMQFQTQPLEDRADTLHGLLAIPSCAAHHHEVVRVTHQCPSNGDSTP